MMDDRGPLPDRAELVERAAVAYADRPSSRTPIPDLMVEFELSVADACAVVRRVEEMPLCRSTFVWSKPEEKFNTASITTHSS
jgi:hypothetical protein